MITLESVASQQCSCGAWESIVVDNNSKDDTRERVESFAAEHPELNLRYVFEQKQGLSYARNAGIMASTGDIKEKYVLVEQTLGENMILVQI